MPAPRDAVRDGLRVALNRPRLFGLAGGALLCEVILRLALGTVHPLLTVVCPPVAAIPLLGAAAPSVSDAVADADATPDGGLRATLRERGPSLLAVAVGGHLVALACGAAAFLVLDTAIRWVLYATGGIVSTVVVHVAPLLGVAGGAFVAWAFLAPAVEHAISGSDVRTVALAPLRGLRDRRRTAAAVGVQVACALVTIGVFFGCAALANNRYATQTAALLAFAVALVSTVGTLALLGTLAYPTHVALARRVPHPLRPTRAAPVKRAVLAVLLVTGLVVGASAIRVTETRPTPDVPDTSLPADAIDAYAAALDRTAARDHRVVVRDVHSEGRVVSTTTVERSDRRIRTVLDTGDGRPVLGYADSGVAYGFSAFSPGLFALGERDVRNWQSARALPGYWYLRDEYTITDGLPYGLPAARTGSWTTVSETDGVRTLALTDGPAVFDALQNADAADATVRTARVRMQLDTERGVVLGGSARLNATISGSTLVRNHTYDVASGPDVDARRPDALGARSLGEWAWDLFAY
ncbi:hypothetical protein [Halarchaeum salinum]|uniref:Uncharacterized protein n=1 Tax=Halarchaeum salinum TaxID=489912 RepID=A0AAV3S538_9EURY